MHSSAQNKNILVLTENFPPMSNGSGRWFWELYSRLPDRDVLIVANDDKTVDTAAFDRTALLNIKRIPLASPEWGIKSMVGLKFYVKSIVALRKLIKSHNIKEIHCGRVIHEGVIAWLLSLITDISFCCYVHGEDVEAASTSREHNLMVKRVCSRAEFLICNSHNSASIVKRLNYCDESKVHVLHPGVDTQRFTPSPRDVQFRDRMGWSNKFVILTVGRLQKRKGQHKMIEAMPLLLKEHPQALYVILGSGECENELLELTRSLGMTDNVQMLADVSDNDMIICYQQCDLFILPNRTIGNDIEGFGMVLVEAQSCAKPVVAGNSGGTRETMVVGDSGEIIDCKDPTLIALFLSNLLKNPDKLKEMGGYGRRHVVNTLDWSAHVKNAISIFESKNKVK
jgi:phosphatidylinositol alpha-1,6-mannosyltransferase